MLAWSILVKEEFNINNIIKMFKEIKKIENAIIFTECSIL